MSDEVQGHELPIPLFTERSLARRWNCSVRTLQRMRAAGLAPPSLRIGRKVHYRAEDVVAFEADRAGQEDAS